MLNIHIKTIDLDGTCLRIKGARYAFSYTGLVARAEHVPQLISHHVGFLDAGELVGKNTTAQ